MKRNRERPNWLPLCLWETDARLLSKSYCNDKVCVAVYVCRGVSQSRVSTFPHSNFSLSQSSQSTRQFALSGFFLFAHCFLIDSIVDYTHLIQS